MSRRKRPDRYTDQAKKSGYPARSVYKLQEIDRRNGLLHPGMSVLDLGAAPGSWATYALRRVGARGRLVAVDIKPITGLPTDDRCTRLVADMNADSTVEQLRDLGPFDLVLSDAAPNTTGNRTVDSSRSAELVEQALSLCSACLAPGGAAVLKLFQGGDEQQLRSSAAALFRSAKLTKPKASRSESIELFLVCTGFSPSADIH